MLTKYVHRFAFVFFLCGLGSTLATAQNSFTIEQCYEAARQNYPLIKQKELISKSTAFTIANAHAGYLPQLTINGQATYQSAVTQVPIDTWLVR